MSYKFPLFFLFVLISTPLFAQYEASNGRRVVLAATQEFEETRFFIYDSLVLKAWYNDTIDAVNEYPEQLLVSSLSADNQDWVNYNYLADQAPQKSNKHFKRISTMDTTGVYYVLQHKFETTYNGVPTAYVKFYITADNEEKKYCAIKCMQYIGKRWYFVSLPGQMNTLLLLMRFKSDNLLQLFRGTSNGDALMDELIADTRSSAGALDFEQLNFLFASWYETNDQIRIDYFLDGTCW